MLKRRFSLYLGLLLWVSTPVSARAGDTVPRNWLAIQHTPIPASAIILSYSPGAHVLGLRLAKDIAQNYQSQFILDLPENGTDTHGSAKSIALAQFILQQARSDAPMDLYILAHSNQAIVFFEQFPPEVMTRFRLVYDMGCNDGVWGERWARMGMQAYVGHDGILASPVFTRYFLPLWLGGSYLKDAVDQANQKMQHDPLFLITHRVGGAVGHNLKDGTLARIYEREPASLETVYSVAGKTTVLTRLPRVGQPPQEWPAWLTFNRSLQVEFGSEDAPSAAHSPPLSTQQMQQILRTLPE